MSNVTKTKTYLALQQRSEQLQEEVERFAMEGLGDISTSMTLLRCLSVQTVIVRKEELDSVLLMMLQNDDMPPVVESHVMRAIVELREALKEEGPITWKMELSTQVGPRTTEALNALIAEVTRE